MDTNSKLIIDPGQLLTLTSRMFGPRDLCQLLMRNACKQLTHGILYPVTGRVLQRNFAMPLYVFCAACAQ